jgi:hypothetical protein
MYTTLDKAVVALIMGVIGVVGAVYKPLNIDPGVIATIVGGLTPIVVYFWPNAPKDPS